MTDWMNQELINERHYSSIFKRITRYTLKPIGIILDRHAPVPTGEPTVDPEGEWMKCEQLNNIIHAGGLLEYSPELQELLLDGQAQRGLIRAIGNLGYDDFAQVMEILKNNRHQLLDAKDYTIWVEGHCAIGQESKANFVGIVSAFSFHEAIQKHVDSLKPDEAKYWNYSKDTNTWTMWGSRAYDNETDARKSFG